MKYWVLKNKFNEFLCGDGYYSFDLVPAEKDYIKGSVVFGETKCSLTELMKNFNKDILPEYKVKPVQVDLEMRYIFKEIKKKRKQ